MSLVRSSSFCLVAGALTAGALLAPTGSAGATTVSSTITIPSTAKYLPVQFLGNGHGHGMSQYGALGAAMAGRTYSQILAFYYPGTTLTTLGSTYIRVHIATGDSSLRVRPEPGLSVTTYGALPTTGVSMYQLVADSAGTLTLRAYEIATRSWSTVKAGLPNRSAFTRGMYTSVRVHKADGTETRYFGQVRAVRAAATGSAAGVIAVDFATLDEYTRGVTPREMPPSWNPAAVAAQAVAARTYGRYAVLHPLDPEYDICDSSMCQVYGGAVHYNRDGTIAWVDDPDAIKGNSNQVLQYSGAVIFAQFAASNGGWSVSGGLPYLVAKQDPYDAAQGDDPYNPAHPAIKMALAPFAAQFGLASLASITLTRDGNGTWNGRVLSGSATGKTAAGVVKTVTFTGDGLQNAVNAVVPVWVGTTWIGFGLPTAT
jgi:SpoIID/LytB domain protein